MVRVIGSGLESYVLRGARKQAMSWVAEAEQEAAKLVAQAAEQAETLHGGTEAQARDQVRAVRRRLLARAELEAREVLLRTQEEMLDRVWRVASDRLAHLDASSPIEQRLARLRALALEAAAQLGGGQLVLQVNEQDAALLTPDVLAAWVDDWKEGMPGIKLALADQAAPILGGVVMRVAGGREMVDNSYDQRLAVALEALRGTVMAMLTQAAHGQEA